MRRERGELREHVVEPLRAADVISPARQMAADDPGDGSVIFHDEHPVHGVPPFFLTVCIPFEHTIQAGKSQIPASPRSFRDGCDPFSSPHAADGAANGSDAAIIAYQADGQHSFPQFLHQTSFAARMPEGDGQKPWMLCFTGHLRLFNRDRQSVRLAQSAEVPESISRPWERAGRTASRFSFAAFGEPGRFTMSVPPRMPAWARDSMARFVTCMEA